MAQNVSAGNLSSDKHNKQATSISSLIQKPLFKSKILREKLTFPQLKDKISLEVFIPRTKGSDFYLVYYYHGTLFTSRTCYQHALGSLRSSSRIHNHRLHHHRIPQEKILNNQRIEKILLEYHDYYRSLLRHHRTHACSRNQRRY